MELQIQTKMTTMILYDYMLRHTYNSFSGILGSSIGALFLLGFLGTRSLPYLLAGIFLLLYLPGSLLCRAQKQMRATPAFQKTLCYRFDEEGIRVSQDGESQLLPWADMYKAVSSGKSIIVYHNRVNAWIFPRRDMGELTPKVIEMISTHMPPEKVKIRW